MPRRFRRARRRRSRACRAAGRCDAGRGDLRPLPATGARRHGRGRWVVRDGHHPREEAVFARYRACLARLACHERCPRVRSPDHRRASRDDDGRRAVWRDPRRRHRHQRRAHRLGGHGARPAARRLGAPMAARRRRLGDARPHRLPHASRVRRQSRERVRGAPRRRHVRGNRAGGRRNQGDRRGDAGGERRGTGRGEPAAPRGAGERGRDDGRDQVGLRARHGERVPAARMRRDASRPTSAWTCGRRCSRRTRCRRNLPGAPTTTSISSAARRYRLPRAPGSPMRSTRFARR